MVYGVYLLGATQLKKRPLDLAELESKLESLALELLRGRFPRVNVEPYFKAAEKIVEERKRQDKNYRTDMESDDPVGNMIVFSMDKVQGAYMLISGELTDESQDRLLKDYELMVGDYLQSLGHLREY